MTRRQQNTHAMHAAVLHLLDEHAALWRDLAPVAEAVAALRAAHTRAAVLSQERNALATGGMTAAKARQRDVMEAAAMRLVRAVRPYARVTGNRTLEAEVAVSPSDFDRASEAAAIRRAERVHAAAEAHLDALTTYKVKASDVTTLRDAIVALKPMRGARDATSAQREARTGALPVAIREARAAVVQLDDLVPGVVKDETLTADYRRVRRTDDR